MKDTEKENDRAATKMDRNLLMGQQHQEREKQGCEIQRLGREEPIEAKSENIKGFLRKWLDGPNP